MNNYEKHLSFILKSVYTFIIVLLIYLFIKYLLGPLLPFITAFVIVALSRKIITKIEAVSHSKKYAAALFTFSLIFILSLTVYGIFFGFFKELSNLSDNLSAKSLESFTDAFIQKISSLKSRIPYVGFLKRFFDYITTYIEKKDGTIIESVSGLLPSLLSFSMRFLSFFPAAVVFLSFMFIAVFYISNDYDKICEFLTMQLPEKYLDTFDETKNVITSTAKELFKSYILLTSITFFQLLSGFLIMGVEYSLLLASVICFVDFLPILGTGTILIPWAAICFFTDNISRAAGLIVLYGTITVFRNIAEPKIVGTNTGLHPLLSLISIFLGIKLIGVAGIIIFPIITITVISLNRKGFIHLYKNFPENSSDKISKTRKKFLDFKRSEKLQKNSSGGDSYDKNCKRD